MKYKKLGLSLFVLLIFAQLATAIGVTSPYYDTKPLGLHPGESVEVQLLLQNMVGGEDVALSASITEGAEIATIVDKKTTYLIPFGTKDVPVLVQISLPEDAQIGETRAVKVSFKQEVKQNANGEMLQIAQGVGAIIPIQITPWIGSVEESSGSSALGWVAGGAGLLLVGGIASYAILRKRRNDFPEPLENVEGIDEKK